MWNRVSRAIRDETGQSLYIIAAAFVALLLIIGLAVDLGLMYVERIRLGRACDAAALAAAQELPFEDFAARRAIQYLKENDYDPSNTQLKVTGPGNASSLSWGAPANSRGVIVIDMDQFEDKDKPLGKERDNSADKILVSGQISVTMNFMRLIGFTEIPVKAHAIAENVSTIDVTIVYDRSGSMGEDTRCYGCYENDAPYPSGTRRYLPYDSTICGSQVPITDGSYEILVAEAEYYSYSTSYAEHNYHRGYHVYPNTYWTLQRVENSQASGYLHTADDRRGAHLMHHPHGSTVPGHAKVTDKTPRLDYEFSIPRAGRWYVWLRTQCGNYVSTSERVDSCLVHWGVDHNGHKNPSYGYRGWSSDDSSGRGGSGAGSLGRKWIWQRMGSVDFGDTKVHEINIWGGGSGFRLDKIVLTRNPEGPSGYPDKAPSFIRDTTPSWSEAQAGLAGYPIGYQTYFRNDRYGGPPDTRGRTGFACDECNPIYGLTVAGKCANGNDDLFDDLQPIRSSQEAAKNFVKRMKARFDQLGYVTYSDQASITRELNCIKQRGYPPSSYGRGVWDFDTNTPDNAWTWCYDHRTGTGGYSGGYDTSSTDGSIMYAIDQTSPGGSTNIADALKKGIDNLSTHGGHYGRPNAASIIVLMTDGQANKSPASDVCTEDQYKNLWPDGGAAKDCVIFYADRAHSNTIIVYTIGLGAQADNALLQEVADRTGGMYYFAPNASDLDRIFQEIADQIFLRLIE